MRLGGRVRPSTSARQDHLWNTARGDLGDGSRRGRTSALGGLRRIASPGSGRVRCSGRGPRRSTPPVHGAHGHRVRSGSTPARSTVLLPAWRGPRLRRRGRATWITFLATSVARYPLTTAEHGTQVRRQAARPAGDARRLGAAGVAQAAWRRATSHTTRGRGGDDRRDWTSWLATPVERRIRWPRRRRRPSCRQTTANSGAPRCAAAVRDAVRPALVEVRAMCVDDWRRLARDRTNTPACATWAGGDELVPRGCCGRQTSQRRSRPRQIHRLGLDTLWPRSTTSTPPAVGSLFGIDDPDAVRRRLRDDRSLALRHGARRSSSTRPRRDGAGLDVGRRLVPHDAVVEVRGPCRERRPGGVLHLAATGPQRPGEGQRQRGRPEPVDALRPRRDDVSRRHPGAPPPAGPDPRERRPSGPARAGRRQHLARAGGCTPSASPARWASTRRPLKELGMAGAATRCGPAASSSTPGSTRWVVAPACARPLRGPHDAGVTAAMRRRDRPVHRRSGSGVQLHDRSGRDRRAARPGHRSRRRPRFDLRDVPRRASWAAARRPWTSWRRLVDEWIAAAT